jgi:hypothetical protein
LRADLAKARDVEVLSAEQARRANELAEGLQRELASEKEFAAAVGEQLSLMTRHLDSVKGVLAATIGHYRATVAEFGGETSAPSEEDSVYAIASWLKRHLAKLPGLINGCTDYGALAGVANYAKLLARGGCTHTESIPEGALPGPEELGETSLGLRKTLRNFIGHFWAPFGRSAARKLAEEKRAKIFIVFVAAPFFLFFCEAAKAFVACAPDTLACAAGCVEESCGQASVSSVLRRCWRSCGIYDRRW